MGDKVMQAIERALLMTNTNIDELMKSIGGTLALYKEPAKPGKAMSVWGVHGCPETDGGSPGALRRTLHLMSLTAESGEVMSEFIAACRRTDGVGYTRARIQETNYVGWVWLPVEAAPHKTAPQLKADKPEPAPLSKEGQAASSPGEESR